MVPRSLIADVGLTHAEFRLYAALRAFSFNTGRCRPSNHALGVALGGRDPGHVSRGLLSLERKGIIRRRQGAATPDNPTGRVILIPEESPAGADCGPGPIRDAVPAGTRPARGSPPRPARTPPARRARAEEDGPRESGEKSTFNVGMAPGTGEGHAISSRGAPGSPPPPPRQADEAAGEATGVPESRGGPSAPAVPVPEAARLLERLEGRGYVFGLRGDGSVEFSLPPGRDASGVMTEEERSELRRLKPAVVSCLAWKARAALVVPARVPGRGEPPRASPPVRAEARSSVHGLIGRLSCSAPGRVVDDLARELVAALGERDPERSLATYRGLARDASVGRNAVAPGLLADAFDEACGTLHVRTTRGAIFLASLKRQLAGSHRGSGGRRGGPPSG